ncbi:MAG TPA: carbonic anhydrase [Bacteroidia bacterium]|nr:carbonic anhydrase [Bacteroidia bacterium]
MKTLSIEERKNITPDKALELLMKGNERFTSNLSINKDHLNVLSTFSNEQKPFAFVLSCIDSRAPVEIIFDQGIGDLFSARVAGNIINDDIIASAEFAVEMIGVKLIFVLGHTNCGAMSACLKKIKNGHLKYLVEKIEPTYLKYQQVIDKDPFPQNKLAELNVLETTKLLLSKSIIIKNAVTNKSLKIATGMYDISNGKVSLLSVFDNSNISG